MKKKTDEKNIHAGHRKRLLDLVVNAGVDNMSDFQVMEFFLTYIFPRGDVNPLAHRLLDNFSSFSQVIEADINDLMSVAGLAEQSAKKIAMFGELFYHYTTAKFGKRYKLSCKADLIDVVEDYLRLRSTENLLLLAISPSSVLTHKRRLNSNSASSVGISALDITNFIATSKASSIVIAHCHPYGSATASSADDRAFDTVKSICETCGVNLIDSYIVGDDGVYSQRDGKLVRTYCDIDQLKTAFKQ